MEYWIWLFTLWGVFSLLAVSLNLMLGEMGLFSLCHAGFFGIGAYTSAILISKFGAIPAIAFISAPIIGLTVALVLIVFVRRAKGDFFALATFSAALAFHSLLVNWNDFTGGAFGMVVPLQSIFEFGFYSPAVIFIMPVWGLVLVLLLLDTRWRKSPLGRVLNAVREDEELALSLGKPVANYRTVAFIFTAAVAAVAGVFYMMLTGGVVDPTGFGAMESVMIVAMVVIGGSGSGVGSILGAGIVVFLPEVLRQAGIEGSAAANIKQILFGLVLYLVLLYRPQGILGRLRVGTEIKA